MVRTNRHPTQYHHPPGRPPQEVRKIGTVPFFPPPYGKRTVLDASFNERPDSFYGQQHGFQGLRLDEESGLIDNRNRILDFLAGRFVQRDPLGYPDGMNAYAAYHLLKHMTDMSGMSPNSANIWTAKYSGNRAVKRRGRLHALTFEFTQVWSTTGSPNAEGLVPIEFYRPTATASGVSGDQLARILGVDLSGTPHEDARPLDDGNVEASDPVTIGYPNKINDDGCDFECRGALVMLAYGIGSTLNLTVSIRNALNAIVSRVSETQQQDSGNNLSTTGNAELNLNILSEITLLDIDLGARSALEVYIMHACSDGTHGILYMGELSQTNIAVTHTVGRPGSGTGPIEHTEFFSRDPHGSDAPQAQEIPR